MERKCQVNSEKIRNLEEGMKEMKADVKEIKATVFDDRLEIKELKQMVFNLINTVAQQSKENTNLSREMKELTNALIRNDIETHENSKITRSITDTFWGTLKKIWYLLVTAFVTMVLTMKSGN